MKPILFPQARLHKTLSLEHPKILSRLYLQNLRSSTFCHLIHVQILLKSCNKKRITLWVLLVHPPGNFWQGVCRYYLVTFCKTRTIHTKERYILHLLWTCTYKNVGYQHWNCCYLWRVRNVRTMSSPQATEIRSIYADDSIVSIGSLVVFSLTRDPIDTLELSA